MSDAICFTGASNNGTHRITSETNYSQPLSVSGYQDSEYVLIAIDVAITVMDTRYSGCIVIAKGESRTTNLDFSGTGFTYTTYVEFLSSGTITFEWGNSKPLHTRITVIGF